MHHQTSMGSIVSDAAREYAACERHVLYLRATGLVRDDVEDPVLDRMDELWRTMSDDERGAARERASWIALRTSVLEYRDVEVDPRTPTLPRRPAAA